MARYPKAQWRPLAAGHQKPMLAHDIFCFHTMVGNLYGTDQMFKSGGWTGTESHFGVGGKWGGDAARGLDGVVYQWGDTAYKADANLDGWDRVISVETADNAPKYAKDIQPWTPKQLDSLVNLAVWACITHKIPPVLIPDTRPGRRGLAWHAQGVEHSKGVGKVPGFLVAGGERWSTSPGKECPGAQRIAQIKTIIVPRVKARLQKPEAPVAAAPLTLNDIMNMKFVLTTQYQVDMLNSNGGNFKLGGSFTLRDAVLWGGPGEQRLLHNLLDVSADVDSVQAALKSLDAQIPDDLGARLSALSAGLGKIPDDLATRLQVLQDALDRLVPPTPTGTPRSV